MLVSAKEMIQAAYAGHYAIGAFNTNNLEWTKAILQAAEEMRAPVIVQVSEGAGKYMAGFKNVADIVKNVMEFQKTSVPVALHLDHGTYAGCKACIEAGFSSIMFICNEKGMSIEAEVGSIGGEEDGVVGMGECADPEECKTIADLGITMLAAGIGNIHGKYPEGWPGLRFDVLDAIKAKVGTMPLVLHGGSGIPDAMVQDAIRRGVSKINVNTECQLAFAEKTRAYIEAGKDIQGKGYDPRKLLAPGAQGIVDMVKYKIEVFGCAGKA